ncbi:MAG: PAS domain-containing protein [Deltaproteobacteria bacterium]|nr:PAS domain-containing protein [Deltaproteobacteria bacterium]
MSVAAAGPDEVASEGEGLSTRKKLGFLMLFRVVLITLVLGTTVALNYADPEILLSTRSIYLFAVIGMTYVLTLVYGLALQTGRVKRLHRFADLQIAIDLAMTTVLVHATGGIDSAYSWFYSASIIGAALVRGRRGALGIAAVSALLFSALVLLTRAGVVPPVLTPSRVSAITLTRQLVVNLAAFLAVGFLAAQLAAELSRAGERLEATRTVASDLAARSADVIRCLSSGLVTVDLDGRVTSWNEAAGDITGIPRSAAEGRPVREVLPALAPLLQQAEAGSALRRAEIALTHPDGGTVWLGLSTSPLTDHRAETIGHIVNFQDLTALREMSAAVKRSEQLAVVGKLAASIAHEIRNPLAAISGSVELLEPPTSSSAPPVPPLAPLAPLAALAPLTNDETRQLIGIVKREVARMNGLVTQLLDYARPRTMLATPLELGVLVRDTVLVFGQDRSFPGVSVQHDEAPAPVMVNADPEQLRQVVWNLIRNGAEAMPDGGTLQVSVRAVPASADAPAHAELVVKDSGAGIASDDVERIFDPFFTTKRRGTGLGLATVYRIVADHQGTIEVATAPGSGAVFTVSLPLAELPSPAAAQ